jgi:FkbM family methyltransferase
VSLHRSPADDGEQPPGSWANVAYQDFRWRMRVPPEDHIGGVLCTGVPYELELLMRTSDLLPSGAVVVDVGSNIGNHAVFWALVAGAKVVALEPNPEALEYLTTNVASNELTSSVEIHQVAAGASDGTAAVADRVAGNLGQTHLRYGTGPIAVSTIDSLLGDTRVDLVKVDVEGGEAAVLTGAVGVLERDRPLVVCEAAYEEHVEEIDAVLAPLGYVRVDENLAWTPTYLWRITAAI